MEVEEYLKIKNASAKNCRVKEYLDARFSVNKYGLQRWLFDQIFFPPHATVLELGCGGGSLWALNLHRLPQDAAVLLTDFCREELSRANKALGARSAFFGFSLVDAEQIPFADSLFDIVIANRMLYFLTDLRSAIGEIARVLKPCGTLYAATMGRRNMAEVSELYFDCFSVQDRKRDTAADRFGLENGAEQLAEFFPSVRLKRYDNALMVTESWPLVEYALSARSFDNSRLTREGIRKFKNYLDRIIRSQGYIRVTRDMGLFIAEK